MLRARIRLVRAAGLFVLLAAAASLGPAAPQAAFGDDEPEGEVSEAEKLAKEEAAKDTAAKATLAADFGKLADEFRVKLRVLGNWCTGAELFQSRTRIAEALLVLDKDDQSAREWLGWKRLKDGRWKPGPWRPWVDKPESLAEFATRRAPLAAAMRERLFPFLERCRDWTTAGMRDGIIRALIAVHPDDAALHELNGETLVKGRWMLRESVATPPRRERIAAAVVQARADAMKVPQKLTVGSAKGEWGVTIDTDRFQVLSEVSVTETRAVADAMLSAQALFGAVLETEPAFGKHQRVYLLRDMESNARFAARCDELDAAERKRSAGLGSWWFPRQQLVVARQDPARRSDSTVRQMIGEFRSPLVTLGKAPPWLDEGLGMYLTYKLLGTRLTVFIDGGEYLDDSISRDVADVDADWIQIARKLVDKGYALDLPVLTGLPLNSLNKDDGLIGYALTAYFVEGRPADLVALLARLKGDDPGAFHQALAETCGVDAPGLQIRFARWLHEIPAK